MRARRVLVGVALVVGVADARCGPALSIRASRALFGATWTKAADLSAPLGQRVAVRCPPFALRDPTERTALWGSEVYDGDSSVCLAAVHAGRLQAERGGTVAIYLRRGFAHHDGSLRNGVLSSEREGSDRSFSFEPDAAPWIATAVPYRHRLGQEITATCPAGAPLGEVFGTDIYTIGSSVCAAAIHAGRLDPTRGGRVTFFIVAGAPEYRGSARNGLLSQHDDFEPAAFSFDRDATPSISWSVSAARYPEGERRRVTVRCPPQPQSTDSREPEPVAYGTDIYTQDSSICLAAQHAGRITAAEGGVVTFFLGPGLQRFDGSTRDGVATREWPRPTAGSLTFQPERVPFVGPVSAPVRHAAWVERLRYAHHLGQTVAFHCPPGGSLSAVWGTDVYTSSSSVCSAAVHAGRITAADGGTVVVRIREGLSSFVGSNRNGVLSYNWLLPHSLAFEFVVTVRAQGEARITWDQTARPYRGHNEPSVTVHCPPRGFVGDFDVRGTDVYTDDSSICGAAVHAERISAERGGSVTFFLRPGLAFYRATLRHGVQSLHSGPAEGSFAFEPTPSTSP
jgi:hypothetical protein